METRSKKDNKRLKKGDSSDSSDNDDDMSTHSDSESEEEMDMNEYRKFVQKIFPSKYLKNKIKQGDKEKNSKIKSKSKVSSKDEVTKKSKSKKNKKSKVEVIDDSEEEEEEEEDEDSDEYETVDEDEDDEIISVKKGLNIIFTIGDPLIDEDDSEYDKEDDSDYLDEDEEDDEDESEDEDEDEDDELPKKKKNREEDLEKQQETINEVRKTLQGILEKDEKNKIAIDGLKELDAKEKALKKSQEKKVKGTKLKNVKKFKNLINKKSLMNDYKYFKDKLSIEEQEKIINEVEELNKHSIVQKPYRLTLLESNIPTNLKSIALNKIASLRYMDPGNGEYYKIKTWVDTFMQIPFNSYKSLPITIDNGVNECQLYMEKSKSMLDEAVYGLNDAKMQIMQLVGQWISNPKAIGTAVAIKGPYIPP